MMGGSRRARCDGCGDDGFECMIYEGSVALGALGRWHV